MVEADFVQRRRRGERRDMSADAGLFLVCAQHHRDRVPADEALDAALDLLAAGERHFLIGRQRVDIRRVRGERKPDAATARVLAELQRATARPRRAIGLKDVVERIQPLGGFNRLEVGDVIGSDISHRSCRLWLSGLRALNLDVLERGEIGRQLGRPAGNLLSLRTYDMTSLVCSGVIVPGASAGIVACTRSKKSAGERLFQLPRNSRPTRGVLPRRRTNQVHGSSCTSCSKPLRRAWPDRRCRRRIRRSSPLPQAPARCVRDRRSSAHSKDNCRRTNRLRQFPDCKSHMASLETAETVIIQFSPLSHENARVFRTHGAAARRADASGRVGAHDIPDEIVCRAT